MRPASARSVFLVIVASGLGVARPGAQTPQPSFDCTEAMTVSERVICSDPNLARQDVELARLYRQVIDRVSPETRASIQTERARWRAARNACGEGAQPINACIADLYKAATVRLQSFLTPAGGATGASTGTASTLTFLGSMTGQHPDAALFERPELKARLIGLLGADAALVPERFQTSGPIVKEGDLVSFSGNKAHQGGVDAALLVTDLAHDRLWVWLLVNGTLRRYGPPDDPSSLPRDAAAMLQNMKAAAK